MGTNEVLYDVIVIGAGPAGLTAALYTGRARFNTLVLERAIIGGELMNRDIIENFPGFPEGVYGPDLGSKLVKQVKNLDVKIEIAEVTGIEVKDGYRIVKTKEGDYFGRAIVVATGAHHKKLNVEGEEEFLNRGVFYCATCDGPAFIQKKVAVVGGGDSGLTEALFLSRIGVKVLLVEQLPFLTAQKILQERAKSDPNIEIRCDSRIERILGEEELTGVEVFDIKKGKKEVLEVDGVLVQIGLEPNTEPFIGILNLDEKGRIRVNEKMETNLELVFACGDVRSNSPGQIITAMGDGATCAIEIQRRLQKN